jgi:predicted RNA-binding protein YlqC (UPF0109 family)
MSNADKLQTYLHSIIVGIVSFPDEVTIDQKIDDMGVLFSISSTNKNDLGMLIGRGGDHINAIRTVLRICGHLNGVKASIKILSQEE